MREKSLLEQLKELDPETIKAAREGRRVSSPGASSTENRGAVGPTVEAGKAPAPEALAKRGGRPKLYDHALTPAERAKKSRERRAAAVEQALETGELADADDMTVATLLRRAITYRDRKTVRRCAQELLKRYG